MSWEGEGVEMTPNQRAVIVHAIRYVTREVQEDAALRQDVYKELNWAVRQLTTEEYDEVMR